MSIFGKKLIENFPKGNNTELKDRVIIMKISDEGRTKFPTAVRNKDELKTALYKQINPKRKDILVNIGKDKVGTDRPILGIDLFDNRFRYYHQWGFNHTLVNKQEKEGKPYELKKVDKVVPHDKLFPFTGKDSFIRKDLEEVKVDADSNYNRQGWENTNPNSKLIDNKLVWSTGGEGPTNSIIVLIGRIGHVLLHDVQTGKQLNTGMDPGLYEVGRIVPHDPLSVTPGPYIGPYRNLPNSDRNKMYPNEYYVKPEAGSRDPIDMPYKVEIIGTDENNNPINEVHELPGAKALLSDLLSYGTNQNHPKQNRVFILLRARNEKLSEGRNESQNHVQLDILPYGKKAPIDYAQNCSEYSESEMSIKDYAHIIFYPNMLNVLVKGMIDFDSRELPYGRNLGISEKGLEIIEANSKPEGETSLGHVPIASRIGAPVLLYNSIRYKKIC